MLDSHGYDVEKYQSEYCDLKCSGHGNIIEYCLESLLRTFDQLLRFFLSEFCQSGVVLLLAVGQKHLQNSAFVLQKRLAILQFWKNKYE